MNETTLEGMQARARGEARGMNPYHADPRRQREWFQGFDIMDAHVRQVLENAENTLRALRDIETLAGDAAQTDQDQTAPYSTIAPVPSRRRRARRPRRS